MKTGPALRRALARPRPRPRAAALALAIASALALGACAIQPAQPAPATPTSAHYGETPPGWMLGAPADTLSRGPWWTLFRDPVLDDLVGRIAVSNQTVALAAAGVASAEAAVRLQRAGFFPTVSVSASAQRSGLLGGSADVRAATGGPSNAFGLGLGASWEPDLWGRIRGGVASAGASAQASEADLAAALLSAQTSFVSSYLSLREADAEAAIIRITIQGYERALKITTNRYDAAIAQKSDVLQAQTTLANAQADLSSLVQSRAQIAHSLAVLAGEAPANFQVPPGDWQSTAVPAVPVGVPSDLLQRRPDIAAAERRVAAANAQIGVARAAWFPALTLSANTAGNASRVGDLFGAAGTAWSLGLALTQAIFDGGARDAAIDQARASWEQTVATYRQTVLGAFAEVEDQLSNASALQAQEALRREASTAADQTEQQMLNRYAQGQVSYADVVTTQASALSARRALLQVSLLRQTSAVALISALGGGWSAAGLFAPAAASAASAGT